ncbi:MAG: NADH-quinone oxidoreductase subunit H [Candidatus Mcinerneyibacterium aminivorans]|uniref:NADH-quinone oxidoreductase subunit H n=1 Tax=Candidatus Mcinerneyibacterium aminivorans TaxID=2703815 RepID=A0A5D0MLH4_9BACT|nr:MAG: NADH-quinone oxidoreductase subunit H [Candidatus Mcinerneyibacterium aminivorans]
MILNIIFRGLILIFGAFLFQVALSGFSRKVVARIQKRYGPVFWQNFRDIFKFLFKETSISHGFIFDFGVLMAFGGTMATLIFLPYGSFEVIPGQTNFIVVIYLLAIGLLGMAMSAVGSANPNASIGISRALTQMLGYELPFLIVVLVMMYINKTSSIGGLVQSQIQNGWNLWSMPIGAGVSFVSVMGMLGKKPFDSPIAPAEIASGPLVEYSGKYLGILMLQHDFATVIEVGLFVNLFLGGGSNILIFAIKYIVVYILMVIISSFLPRFKVEESVKFFWKWGLSLAFLQAVISLGIYLI